MKEVGAEDWVFIQAAVHFALANPFAENRIDGLRYLENSTDLKSESTSLSQDALQRLNDILSRLNHSPNTTSTKPLNAPQIDIAWMLLIYFRHRRHLENHIRKQNQSPDKVVTLDVADQIMSELRQAGFSDAQSERLVAVFYQLRRAHLFISELLTGNSVGMSKLRQSLWNNLFTSRPDLYLQGHWQNLEDFSTLILGETGSGKGNVARALGRSNYIPFDSKTNCLKENFCSVITEINLSEFPPSLIESELFGHRKGSFTGAIDNYEGVFSRTSACGALFIDEIGEIDDHLQVKLLRVLQGRVFSPVGSKKLETFRGRIIAATNRPLRELAGGVGFRRDFFFRLCSDIIEVPSLRERIRDDSSELQQLVKHIAAKMFPSLSQSMLVDTSREICATLPKKHFWPGNVRELEQAVRSFVIHSRYDPVPGLGSNGDENTATELQEISARDLIVQYCSQLYQKLGTFEAVASITKLDRRTVSKYISESSPHSARNIDEAS